ncbi:MAG: hypothetical protein ACOCRK_07045 [bacterium]
MKYKTIKDATEAWINTFQQIPQNLIKKAYTKDGYFDIEEFNRISLYRMECQNCREEFYTHKWDSYDVYCPECESGDIYSVYEDGGDYLPMWGWLWLINNSLDSDWIREHLKEVSELGFYVYESDEGLFVGIDGVGYDFYEAHWIPLYKTRGLQWHITEE